MADARGGASRLLALICAVLLLEALLFTALTPLLPGLTDEVGLSTSQAGLLTAAYGAGMLFGAIPAAMGARRLGVKPTLIAGLISFAAMSLGFGLAQSYETLLTAQLLAGAGGAAIWTAGLAWLIEATDAGRRGEMIGVAFGAAAAGQILGPIVGGIASAAGRAATFGGISVWALLLGCAALRAPAPPGSAREGVPLRAVIGSRPVLIAAWLNAVPPAVLGGLMLVATLHLDELGASAGEIASTFVAVAAVGIVFQPAVGRWSDRRGRMRPIQIGLLTTIPLVLALAWIQGRWAVAALVVLALVAVRAFWGPVLTLLSDACDSADVGQVPALGIGLVAGTAGFVAGAAGSGAIVQGTGRSWSYGALALLLLLVLVAVRPWARTGT